MAKNKTQEKCQKPAVKEKRLGIYRELAVLDHRLMHSTSIDNLSTYLQWLK